MDEWIRKAAPQSQGLELVGISEVADRLQVKRATVDRWRQRELLPAPGWVVSGTPVWLWGEVKAWAVRTGRL